MLFSSGVGIGDAFDATADPATLPIPDWLRVNPGAVLIKNAFRISFLIERCTQLFTE